MWVNVGLYIRIYSYTHKHMYAAHKRHITTYVYRSAGKQSLAVTLTQWFVAIVLTHYLSIYLFMYVYIYIYVWSSLELVWHSHTIAHLGS